MSIPQKIDGSATPPVILATAGSSTSPPTFQIPAVPAFLQNLGSSSPGESKMPEKEETDAPGEPDVSLISRVSTNGINALPEEVLIHIFGYLSAREASTTSGVCQHWNALLNDGLLWRYFSQRDLQLTARPAETKTPKAVYQAYCLNQNLEKGIYTTHVITKTGGRVFNEYAKHQKLAISVEEGIEIWDLKTGSLERTLEESALAKRMGHDSLSITDNKKVIALDLNGNEIKIWDLESGKCEHTVKGAEDQKLIRAFCLTPDGRKLVLGTLNGQIMIRNLDSKIYEKLFEESPGWPVTHLCFSKKGFLISVSADNKIRFWDFETKMCKKTLDVEKGMIDRLSFSEDGELLISGDTIGEIKIWNLEKVLNSEEDVCADVLTGHTSRICSLCPTKNGKLFSVSRFGEVTVWDLQSRTREYIPTMDLNVVLFLSLIEDRKVIFLNSWRDKFSILDFNASNSEVFEELAQILERSAEPFTANLALAMERFSRMPELERNEIYRELEIILERPEGSGKEAFHGIATPEQRAQAIRNYLKGKDKAEQQ